MKKISLAVFLLISILGSIQAQKRYLPEPALIPDNELALWGYLQRVDCPPEGSRYELKIGYQFQEAYSFNKYVELARIKLDGKYGFISPEGVIMIKPQFDGADDFYGNGFCRVTVGDKQGLIDTNGNFLIPPKYDNLNYYYDGWFEAQDGDNWSYIFYKGSPVCTQSEMNEKKEAGLKIEDLY